MVAALGIDQKLLFTAVFTLGSALAGLGGALALPNQSANLQMDLGVIVEAFVVVVVGGLGSIPGVILGAAVVVILNLQILQGLSLALSDLRQSDAVIPVINFAWKNLSTQLDPAKYQKMLFGLILVIMMIYRPAGIIPAERRKREMGPPGLDIGQNSAAENTAAASQEDSYAAP